jgi:hypothetical protein
MWWSVLEKNHAPGRDEDTFQINLWNQLASGTR